MALRFDKPTYNQRWQVETVNSMIKRLLGSALRARTYWSQCREITLRAITLNVMIIRRQIRAFLQSRISPIIDSELAKRMDRSNNWTYPLFLSNRSHTSSGRT